MKKYKKAFLNGKIYTLNPKQKWAEAVVVSNNTIVCVGTNKAAETHIDKFTEVIDLKNRLVLPGFIDSHAHVVMGGQFLLNVDLTLVKIKQEFCKKIKDYLDKTPKARWIVGGNWNHQNWNPIELPTKDWVDSFSQDRPVFISRMDYHLALANSYVLELAGIDRNTIDPPGGEIVRDENGEPTGILKDKAMELVYNIIPEPSEKEFAETVDAAMEEARRLGVTSIHDVSYDNHFRALLKANREDRLTSRLYTMILIKNYRSIINNEIEYNFGSEKLKIGSMKAFADGSLGSKTALFFEPYEYEEAYCGLAMEELSSGKLEEMIIESDKNRLQCCIHAIGDKAISEILDIVEKLRDKNPEWDRRFRIEHSQHITKKDIKRAAKLDVIISAQPYHIYDDGCWAENLIGSNRINDFYAFRTMLNSGVKLCFGSDWSVATMDPILGIYVAVTRDTADHQFPDGLNPVEKITVEDAIECYTINGAYASFQEEKVGSIEVGKFADIIVLSDNLFEISPESIKDVKVELTIFDGEIVYNAD